VNDDYEDGYSAGWDAADKSAQDELTRLRAENEALREISISTLASLVAAVSLLERGGKKAAASDKMFYMMLADYKAAIDAARAALKETKNE
jgi:hypothetical protein